MKKIITILFLVYIGVLMISCSDDNSISAGTPSSGGGNPNSNLIDPAFLTYVLSFDSEMSSRSINVDTENLTVEFVNAITAPNSQGFCAYGYPNFQNTGKPKVEVINSSNCWSSRTDTEKENLIYHELGHALLNLGHQNGTLPNGSQLSLMCASTTCNNYRVYNKNQPEQRAYYLDNLVGQSSQPEWADEKVFTMTIDEEYFDNEFEGWQNFIVNSSGEPEEYNFFIDKNSPFSSPNSLGISVTDNESPIVDGYWYKEYTISNFEYCSNLEATVNIRSENITDGFIALVVDLMESGNKGELEFFSRSFNLIDAPGNGTSDFENVLTTSICLTQETEIVRVLFYYNSTEKGTVYFDNLKLDLLE